MRLLKHNHYCSHSAIKSFQLKNIVTFPHVVHNNLHKKNYPRNDCVQDYLRNDRVQDYPAVNEVYAQFFSKEAAPARAAYQVILVNVVYIASYSSFLKIENYLFISLLHQ